MNDKPLTLNVVLIGVKDPDINALLPFRGEITLHTGAYSRVDRATFRPIEEDGILGEPVGVEEPMFFYDQRYDLQMVEDRRDAAASPPRAAPQAPTETPDALPQRVPSRVHEAFGPRRRRI